jgi:hypothetical protein
MRLLGAATRNLLSEEIISWTFTARLARISTAGAKTHSRRLQRLVRQVSDRQTKGFAVHQCTPIAGPVRPPRHLAQSDEREVLLRKDNEAKAGLAFALGTLPRRSSPCSSSASLQIPSPQIRSNGPCVPHHCCQVTSELPCSVACSKRRRVNLPRINVQKPTNSRLPDSCGIKRLCLCAQSLPKHSSDYTSCQADSRRG